MLESKISFESEVFPQVAISPPKQPTRMSELTREPRELVCGQLGMQRSDWILDELDQADRFQLTTKGMNHKTRWAQKGMSNKSYEPKNVMNSTREDQ